MVPYADSMAEAGGVNMLTIKQQLELLTSTDRAEMGARWLHKLDRVEHLSVQPGAAKLKYFKEVKGISDPAGVQQVCIDGTPLHMSDLISIVECVAAYHAVTTGVRVINVSEEEADLYSHTDLHDIDAREWHQSYPLLLVRMPMRIFPRLIGVMGLPQLKCFCNLFAYDKPLGRPVVVEHCYVGNDFELALRPSTGGERVLFTPEAGRVAVNAVLHLANYPDLYGRHSERASKITIRTKGAGHPNVKKRFDLIPQIIRLRTPLTRVDGGHAVSRSPGTAKRPHWRRGHWRRVRFGPNQALLNSIEGIERRHNWIKPVLVNAKLVGESRSQTTLFVP
jgi:hypothetical protein